MDQKKNELSSSNREGSNCDNSPNYKRIYNDLLELKFPDKIEECKRILKKEALTELDILALNDKIFGKTINKEHYKGCHRAYSEAGIRQILDYQKKNSLNNLQLANKFGMSRNTITKWKRIFKI